MDKERSCQRQLDTIVVDMTFCLDCSLYEDTSG